jgi:hypothetical protein
MRSTDREGGGGQMKLMAKTLHGRLLTMRQTTERYEIPQ